MGVRFVVWGFEHGDKIIAAKHWVLSDHLAAEVGDFQVYFVKPIRIAVQCAAPFRRQRAQQDVILPFVSSLSGDARNLHRRTPTLSMTLG